MADSVYGIRKRCRAQKKFALAKDALVFVGTAEDADLDGAISLAKADASQKAYERLKSELGKKNAGALSIAGLVSAGTFWQLVAEAESDDEAALENAPVFYSAYAVYSIPRKTWEANKRSALR